MEDQLRHLPCEFDFMGLNIGPTAQAEETVRAKVNTNDEKLDPSYEPSQQVAGEPTLALVSTQDSIEASIEASPERQTQVSSAWEAFNEESSSQSISKHTLPQCPSHSTPYDVTACSTSRDTSSWPS